MVRHNSLFKSANDLTNFKSIANFAANGSEVVLDYSTDFQELNGIERLGSMGVAQFTYLLKEPLLGQFKPRDLHQAVEQMGFEVVEDLSVKPSLNDILMHVSMKFATPQQHGYCICV